MSDHHIHEPRTTMTDEQTRMHDHLHAAGEVINDALNALRAEKPDAGTIIDAAILQGAILTVRTVVAFTTGLATISVYLTMPDGKTLCLSAFDFHYQPQTTLN